MCYSGKYTESEMIARISKVGGLTDHLKTNDAREIVKRINEGDEYAELIYNAFIYQAGKQVGACAAVLEGKVDAIILTGGMSKDPYLKEHIKKYIEWIAPVVDQAGEFETEGLASGAVRALTGKEPVKEYTGVPVFDGFHCKGAPVLTDYKG